MNLILVRGRSGGLCLYLNDYRIAGEKPWGGGATVCEWTVTAADIRTALKRGKPRDA